MSPTRMEIAILAGCAVAFFVLIAGRYLLERSEMPPLPYGVPITSLQVSDLGVVCVYYVPGAGVWGWTKAELGHTPAQACPAGAK